MTTRLNVLKHSRFVDIKQCNIAELDYVYYFIEKYNEVLNFSEDDINKIDDEFISFQQLDINRISDCVWEKARVKRKCVEEQDEPIMSFRMDVLWTHLACLKFPDGCSFLFARLSKIAFLVMTIPHSNAAEERIFNLIRANRTDSRHSLDTEGTLSSIVMIKMANLGPNFKPSRGMLESAKKATWTYNQKHKN